jgi:hypothetical protein
LTHRRAQLADEAGRGGLGYDAQFRTYKVIYRRYAGLFFSLCVDLTENELACLEAIHLFVEVLDHFFQNVCELDLVFNFHKVSGSKHQMVRSSSPTHCKHLHLSATRTDAIRNAAHSPRPLVRRHPTARRELRLGLVAVSCRMGTVRGSLVRRCCVSQPCGFITLLESEVGLVSDYLFSGRGGTSSRSIWNWRVSTGVSDHG